MRMIRGTGLYGLSAMIPKRAFGSVTIIRPLLAVKKNKLIKYLDSKKIKYRIDKTNKKIFTYVIKSAISFYHYLKHTTRALSMH